MRVRVELKPRTPSHRIYVFMLVECLTEISIGGSTIDKMLGAGVTENPVAKIPVSVHYKSKKKLQDCKGKDALTCLCNAINTRDEKVIEEVVPYIPGSTLKGLLRNIAENVARKCNRYCTFGELVENLARVLEDEPNITQLFDEILDKLVSKILEQFIDDELTKRVVKILREQAKQRNVREVLIQFKENPASVLEGGGLGDYTESLAEMLKSVLNLPIVYHDVCNPVVEGLACELPLPRFKLKVLQAIANCLGDEIKYPCKACRVFGLPGYASRVHVTSAYPAPVKDLFVTYRLHIALDRLRGSVATGRTFDIEMLAPGAKFAFMVSYDATLGSSSCSPQCTSAVSADDDIEVITELENLKIGDKKIVEKDPDYELFVKTLMEAVKEPQWLGRRKTVGLGLVKMRPLFTAIHDLASNKLQVVSVNTDLVRKFGTALQHGIPGSIHDILAHLCRLYRGGSGTC